MRSMLFVCAVVSVLALTAGMANAANPGQVSNSALAQFGLSGMQTMSDVQGTDIRGKGFVSVSGYSSASLLGGATSGYTATAIGGNSYATGADFSATAAGVVVTRGLFAAGGISVAGSFSSASAR